MIELRIRKVLQAETSRRREISSLIVHTIMH